MLIFLFFVFVVLGIILVMAKKTVQNLNPILGPAAFALAVIFLTLSMVRMVGPGQVGVQVLFGKVQERTLKSGLHFVNPLISLERMTIRTQAYTMSSKAGEGQIKGDDAIMSLTAEGLRIALDVTVWFHLIPEDAAMVYRDIGTNYISKIVRPTIRTAIRSAAVNYNATDIYSSKRAEVTDKILYFMREDLKTKGVLCEKILLRQVELPPKVKDAIDDKIAAEQDAQKMKFILQKETQEAERKRIEANGISMANKVIANSLSSRYLQWYYIKTLGGLIDSPNNTVIVLPFDQKLTPLLNIPSGR
ncbi:MAG: prohibitin family protein [Candidatus Cloacimonadota bacterium]|nr:MAG: prohibitin family protein [Candidatus Cloacimonadota bacterium]